jgi:predicted permease
MTLFLTILSMLIPLYLIIGLGFIGARILKAQIETIAKLLIYIIVPGVIFYGTYTAEINYANLSLPVLFFILASGMALVFLAIGTIIFKEDSTKNILAFTAGTGNTGYFGLPVIYALLGDQAFSLAVLSIIGFVLYENSVGFFLTAKGNHSGKESMLKVIKLPTLYAFCFGLLLNLLKVQLGENAVTMIDYFKGAYTLLGMMIIGMGLANIHIHQIDYKFVFLACMAKFIFWPLIIIGIIALDRYSLQLYNYSIYNVLIIMAIVPMSASTVAVATELKVHPEKAAVAVLLSTVFALFYIPLITSIFIIR